jgi:hypothetical protein
MAVRPIEDETDHQGLFSLQLYSKTLQIIVLLFLGMMRSASKG